MSVARREAIRDRRRDGAWWIAPLRALEPVLVVVVLLALWELASSSGNLSNTLPPPSEIAGEMFDDVQTQALWSSVGASMEAWAIGMAIVIGVGVPLGLLLGSSEHLYRATHLTIEFVRTVPSIAALPFLVLLYGVTLKLAVVLVVLTALWPLLLQVMYGVRDVDPVTIETGRVYRLGPIRRFVRITVPSASPYIGTGLRLSGVTAMVVAIAVSLVAGGEGLGASIREAEQYGDTALTYARILLTSLLGLALTIALLFLERRLLRWHPSQRGGMS